MTPKRADDNQRQIVADLRKIGMSVQSLGRLAGRKGGEGAPDICVGWHGRNYLFQIKVVGATLTPDETDWINKWRGQVSVILAATDAIEIMQAGEEEMY